MEIGGVDDAGRGAGFRNRLHDREIEPVAHRRAAIGFRHEDRVEPQRLDSINAVLRKRLLAVVARRVRRDHGVGNAAYLIEQDPLVLCPLPALIELLEDFHQ